MYSIFHYVCLQTSNKHNSRILTIKNVKFSFEHVFIWIYIHFNMHSFECIERFSNFYLHTCDKDLRQKRSFEENQESCNICCKHVKILLQYFKKGFLTQRFAPRLNRCYDESKWLWKLISFSLQISLILWLFCGFPVDWLV